MTTFALDREVELSPVDAVTRLVDRHGLRAVLSALATAVLQQRRGHRASIAALDDHLRRDIGLPPLPPKAEPFASAPGWVRW